jgi:hypothetical protein
MGDGMGMKLALNIMTMSHLLSGIAVAIFNAWQISLVMICLSPPLFIVGPIAGKVFS